MTKTKTTEREKQTAKRAEKYADLLIKDANALRDRLCLLYDDLSNELEQQALSDAFGACIQLRDRLCDLYAKINCYKE